MTMGTMDLADDNRENNNINCHWWPPGLVACQQQQQHHQQQQLHQLQQLPQRPSVCAGCRGDITDPFILRVQPDLEWHAGCLRCTECSAELTQSRTCFVRDGKPYCRDDYSRLFGSRCAKCNVALTKSEPVMRARTRLYHVACFRCQACTRQLVPGEEFGVRRDDGGIYCRADFDALQAAEVGALSEKSPPTISGVGGCGSPEDSIGSGGVNQLHQDMECNDEDSASQSTASEPTAPNGGAPSGAAVGGAKRGKAVCGGGRDNSKATRVRTVLNEKQLHTLRTCYAANPRPDALMKEQLVEMTGLSPRVIRVWFQNKRCKDKKKQLLMKQMEHQQQKRTLNGIPMIASSPVRHDPRHLGGQHLHHSSHHHPQQDSQQSYAAAVAAAAAAAAASAPWCHVVETATLAQGDSACSQQQQQQPLFQQLVGAYQHLFGSDANIAAVDSCKYEEKDIGQDEAEQDEAGVGDADEDFDEEEEEEAEGGADDSCASLPEPEEVRHGLTFAARR